MPSSVVRELGKAPSSKAKLKVFLFHKHDIYFEEAAKQRDVAKVYKSITPFDSKAFVLQYLRYDRAAQVQSVMKALKCSPQDAEDVVSEVAKAVYKANSKRLVLRKLLLSNNPHLPCHVSLRYSCEAAILEPCERLYESNSAFSKVGLVAIYAGFIFYVFVISVVLLFGLTYHFIATSCCNKKEHTDEEVEWVLQRLREHPELDTDKVNSDFYDDLKALCQVFTAKYDKPFVLWAGFEHEDRSGSGASFDQDEYVILIRPKQRRLESISADDSSVDGEGEVV